MKVLMLGWELPPNNSGGLGIACYNLCQSLSKNNLDLEFILPYHADHQIDFMTVTAASPQGIAEIVSSGLAYDSYKYKLMDGSERYLNIYEQVKLYEKTVLKLAETKQFDILHAHDWLTFSAALKVKAIKNCPIILHVHSIESDRAGSYEEGNPLVKEIEELAFLTADQIIAVSHHTKKAIINDYAIPAEKIEVVHNSINPSDMVPLDDNNAYAYLSYLKLKGYKVVVNIGRLTKQKGLPNLLQAAKEVIKQAPKTIFLIVGMGEQFYELLNLAAELNIGPNILFADFQRGKNWRDAYAIGDLFVMPSISEPFGLTPLEAIAYGTPALITKQSGVSEILKNCLKVDFWDINEMANQITAVILNKPLHDVLLENASQEYLQLSWTNASKHVMNVYERQMQGAAL